MEFIKCLKSVVSKQHRRAGTRAYYSGGEVYFSRLFGYRLISNRYEPDLRFSEHIKTTFTLLAAGKTLPEVKAVLDNMKARDSSNNRYSYARIMALIRPIYAGFLDSKGRTPVGNLTAIVSLDTFRKAEKQLRIERKKLVNQ